MQIIEKRRPHIFLIIIDTLRYDYGNKYLKDLLGKFGFISYDNVISPSPWTTPSHASILTGKYPSFHGAHETKNKKIDTVKIPQNRILLSHVLSDKGYFTYLLSANALVSPYYGYSGFRYYKDFSIPLSPHIFFSDKDKRIFTYARKDLGLSGASLIKYIISQKYYITAIKMIPDYIINKYYESMLSIKYKWPLHKRSSDITKFINKYINFKRPTFIFINFMEVHEPYFIKNNDFEVTAKSILGFKPNNNYINKWRQGYKSSLNILKNNIQKLIKTIDHVFDSSFIIITSDHGQSLGENSMLGHGTHLYEEIIKVPLFIKYPTTIKIINPEDKYITTSNIYPFVINMVNGKLRDDSSLYEDVVFSESHGIHVSVPLSISHGKIGIVNHLEKFRIAAFYKGIRATFNVSDNIFENITVNNKISNFEMDNFKKYIKNYIFLCKSLKKIRTL